MIQGDCFKGISAKHITDYIRNTASKFQAKIRHKELGMIQTPICIYLTGSIFSILKIRHAQLDSAL